MIRITTKKRNIYIGIIVFCVVAALAVITLSKPSLPEIQLPLSSQIPPKPTSADGGFAISVFPQNVNFDLSIFETNERFKSFKEYEPIAVDPNELGRDNPFIPY